MGIGPWEPRCATFCLRHFFEHLQMACTKTFTAELMDVSRLWSLNEREVEELLFLWSLSGVLEVNDGLDRTGMKKYIKTAKFHALECGPGCTSWICNNWTAGLTAE